MELNEEADGIVLRLALNVRSEDHFLHFLQHDWLHVGMLLEHLLQVVNSFAGHRLLRVAQFVDQLSQNQLLLFRIFRKQLTQRANCFALKFRFSIFNFTGEMKNYFNILN